MSRHVLLDGPLVCWIGHPLKRERIKAMKKPTWKQLGVVAAAGNAHSYLQETPKEWRPAIALALSCAKWSPARGKKQGCGEGACGLCALYDSRDAFALSNDCLACPLYNKTGLGCGESGSIFDDWCAARTSVTKTKHAYRLYNMLMRLYKQEYKK